MKTKLIKYLITPIIPACFFLCAVSCKNTEVRKSKCDLIFNSGSNSSLSKAGDYVDYLIDEPINKGTKQRWENGHSYNETQIIPIDDSLTRDDVLEYFGSGEGGYNPWVDSGNPEDKLSEWPEYGFHYDYAAEQGAGRWHLKFKLLHDVQKSFIFKINFINVVYIDDKKDGGIVSYSKDYYFYFHPLDKHGQVAGHNINDIDYYFSMNSIQKDDYGLVNEISNNLNSSFKINNSSEDKTMNGWSKFLINTVHNEQYSKYQSNVFAFLSIIEAYIFEYNLLYSDNSFYFTHWNNSKQKWTYTEKDLLSTEQKKLISIDSYIQTVQTNNNQISFDSQQTILLNSTEQIPSIIEVNEKNERYLFTSSDISSLSNGYLNYLDDSSEKFILTRYGNCDWQIFNHSEIKLFDLNFNFITNGFTNKIGTKLLLSSIFEDKEIVIN